MPVKNQFKYHAIRDALVLVAAIIVHIPHFQMPKCFLCYAEIAGFMSIVDVFLRMRTSEKKLFNWSNLEISLLSNAVLIPSTLLLSQEIAPQAVLLFWALMLTDFLAMDFQPTRRGKLTRFLFYLVSILCISIFTLDNIIPFASKGMFSEEHLNILSALAFILVLYIFYGVMNTTLNLLKEKKSRGLCGEKHLQ